MSVNILDMKHLYRSNTNKVFAGIFGGLGEYMDVDPVVLRFGYLLITIFSGVFPGLIAYLFSIAIIPKHNISKHEHTTHS